MHYITFGASYFDTSGLQCLLPQGYVGILMILVRRQSIQNGVRVEGVGRGGGIRVHRDEGRNTARLKLAGLVAVSSQHAC